MCIEVVIERGVLETEGVGGYFVCLLHAQRLGARWVEHHDSHLILGEELAQGPAVGVAVLIELHPLHGFVVKRKRPGVGAWVTC